MRIPLRAFAACLFLLFVSFSAFSQVYKWRDKDGNLIVSTTPPPPGVKSEKQKTTDTSQAETKNSKGRDGISATQEVELTRSNRDIKVILYVTDWCPHSKEAREYLESLNVDLAVYDIDKDSEKNEEFLAKGKGDRSVPLIDIEGILLRGFGERSINLALEKRRHAGINY
jgi:glutaredoxin 3